MPFFQKEGRAKFVVIKRGFDSYAWAMKKLTVQSSKKLKLLEDYLFINNWKIKIRLKEIELFVRKHKLSLNKLLNN